MFAPTTTKTTGKFKVLSWNLEHMRSDKLLRDDNEDIFLGEVSKADVAFFYEAKTDCSGTVAKILGTGWAGKAFLCFGGDNEKVICAWRTSVVESVGRHLTIQEKIDSLLKTGQRPPVALTVSLKVGGSYTFAAWHNAGPAATTAQDMFVRVLEIDGIDAIFGDFNWQTPISFSTPTLSDVREAMDTSSSSSSSSSSLSPPSSSLSTPSSSLLSVSFPPPPTLPSTPVFTTTTSSSSSPAPSSGGFQFDSTASFHPGKAPSKEETDKRRRAKRLAAKKKLHEKVQTDKGKSVFGTSTFTGTGGTRRNTPIDRCFLRLGLWGRANIYINRDIDHGEWINLTNHYPLWIEFDL